MADDKTEKPTPKRLQEARKKGQVFKSADMTQAVLFLAAGAALSFSGPLLVERLRGFMTESLDPKLLSSTLDPNQLAVHLGHGFATALILTLPLAATLAILSLAVDFAQIGGLVFSTESLSPNFAKLNPIAGLQNLFLKSKTYLELVKNIVKLVVISWLSYSTITSELRDLVVSSRIGLAHTAALVPALLFGLLYKVGGAFLLLGAADFMIQKKLFMKGLMMSKEEIKREYKEQEGDPHVKGHRRQLAMELLRENAVKRVPEADVVVVNPTHLAVALKYDEERMNAPQVIAKGELFRAQKIRDIAERSNVPVLQDVQLARSLYTLEIEEEIPEDLYEAVAEILKLAATLSERDGSK